MDYEIGESRKKGGLLKTGQTTQYGGYADDGYYEKGLSKKYTILTTGPYSGTTNITLNAKTEAHSNNCVYDQITKLMWSRYVAGSVGPSSNGTLPWTTNGNGEGIFTYAAAANAAALSGYTDWRIPNINELASLIDHETPTAAPNSTAFPSYPTADNTQSSTTRPGTTTETLSVQFSNAAIPGSTKTGSRYTILVRGG